MELALPTIVLFLALMAGIALWHAPRVRTSEDFTVAGRRLGAPVLAGTLVATWIGTGSLFGNSEFTYLNGISGFLLPLSGITGMLVLAWVAPRVRDLPATSVPGILGLRFGPAARVLAALAIASAYIVIVSYQYRAGAAVAERIFPASDQTTLRLGFAAFIILYTALAGLASVVWTDVANGVILALGLVAGVVFAAFLWDPAATPLPVEATNWSAGLEGVAFVNVMLPPFLLILGDANMYQRFLAARSPATARKAAFSAFAGLLVLESAIIGIAFLGRVLLPEAPANPGHVIIEMAFTVFPPVIGLLLAATAVAVIVSTADSYLLVSATTVADLAGRTITPTRQRLLVVAIGIFALLPAFWWEEFLSVALYAYTLYGASLTPAVLAALFRPRTSSRAVVAGMAAGLGTALIWKVLLEFGYFGETLAAVDPVLPALAANAILLVAVDVSGRRPTPDLLSPP